VAPPELDTRTIQQLLTDEVPHAGERRLVLVHGRYTGSPTLTVHGRRAHVTDQRSVLGIHDAWITHREQDGDDLLVVVHPLDDDRLGWDLRGHAVRRSTLTVDLAQIVQRRFGATDLDPRVRERRWLVVGLLEAEPAGGWRRSGPVLTLDVAVRALLTARLGLDDPLDAGALLDWAHGPGPARFVALPAEERAGLTGWLAENIDGAAAVLMALVDQGRVDDAMAIGLIAGVLDEAATSADAAVAVGGLLGSAGARPAERRAFTEAVEGTLQRWVSAAEGGGASGEAALRRVLAVGERADELAAGAGLTAELAGNRYLPSAFRARLRAVAATLAAEPDHTLVLSATAAASALREHHLARLYPERCSAADMAVRLQRMLAAASAVPTSVGSAVSAHLADGGWADRALSAVWAGESIDDPVVARGYRTVHDAARGRRHAQDEAFATVLGEWTAHASAQVPGGALLVEQVLDEIAVPLLSVGPAPLVVVVDGMSAAVAVELGEQLVERGWTEVSREAGRRSAAVATVPSVTTASRASLLTGRAVAGDQGAEREGFTAFWRKHRRGALLAHKADIAGPAGRRLAEPLVAALAADDVAVGVVLNTVDDALDHGREGDRTGWRIGDITYLPDLLDAARSYARPVVLVADHGHVLDRGAAGGPHAATGVESARWRTGEPGEGEVALSGPRVLLGGGRVVVPWREDLRYTRRRAGYHGGASLAEMAVPVLVLTPTPEQLPLGWSVLPVEAVEPPWWSGRRATPAVAQPRPARRAPRRAAPADGEGLFAAPAPAAPRTPTLGAQVTASDVYKAQRTFVRRAPEPVAVAAVIDALAVEGRLSATATAAAAGRAGRDPDGVVATLQRLLNVEGYPVLTAANGTVELNVDLLRLQFQVGP
jgi:hypothetical protein